MATLVVQKWNFTRIECHHKQTDSYELSR